MKTDYGGFFMNILEAKVLYENIAKRYARRSFIAAPSDEQMQILNDFASQLNQMGESHIRLAVYASGAEDVFQGFLKSYGIIKGAQAFAALIILPSEQSEIYKRTLLGYLGEQLVLKITSLGIGCSWVGGTYSVKDAQRIVLKDGEDLICVVPMGIAEEGDRLVDKIMRGFTPLMTRKRKKLSEIIENYDVLASSDEWIQQTAEAVRIAPSSYNKQPWKLKIAEDGVWIKNTEQTVKSYLDLGIAMSHLEITANANNICGVWVEENHDWLFKPEKQ